MTFKPKTLLFGKYLFLAQIIKNNTLNVHVREFNSSLQNGHTPSWNQSVSIKLSVNRVKSKSGNLPKHENDQRQQNILSFDSTEDNLSGIIRPTLMIIIPDQNNSSSIVFIVVLSQLTNIENEMVKKWSLVPIKKVKVSNNHVCHNTIFIDQLSFIYTENGQILYCYSDRDCVVPFNMIQENDKAGEIVHLASRNYNGECLIIGVYMLQEDITDDSSSSIFKLFVKKSRHKCKNDVEFVDLDPSDFLPEDYASCITSMYINYIEYCNHTDSAICCKTLNHIKIMTNIFIVLSSGYLLEFSSGQLILSLCLTHLYRSLSCDEIFSPGLASVEGVIQSDNRKLVILKSFNNCVTIDTTTQKVHQHWSDVEYVFIGDILSRGSDQLLLIFQSMEHYVDLQYWFLTDFNTIFIDKRHNVSEEQLSKDCDSRFLSVKNALQQQLSKMNLAVENAESRLKDKVEFLKNNLSRLHRKTGVPVLLKQRDYTGESESKQIENDVISVDDVWNQILDDQLVVGVTVINKSSRCLSRMSLSLVNKDSSFILQTKSKWHVELSSPPDLSFTTISTDEKHSVKKLKVDGNLKQTNAYCDLLPNQEVFLTLCCSLSSLSDIPKDTITITLFLHYCCHTNPNGRFEEKKNLISSIQMCSRFPLLLREILQNTFTDQLLHSTHLENCTGTLHHRKLCLKAIQCCTRLNFETKYGHLNHVDNWLNKIPNLIYHPTLCCYIYTGSGLLCLVRLEVILASNLKQAEVKVYTRNDQQFNLFMQLLSSYLPDNISYKMASTRNTNIRINRFLMSACEEIESGISLSNQFYTNVKEEVLNIDLINQESVHRFQNQFENEKKILCSNSLERTQPDLVLTQLRNVEEITDISVGNILLHNVDSNNVLR